MICDGHTCKGQLAAFPPEVRPIVRLVDAVEVNRRLGISEINDHGYLVTQSHAVAWSMLKEPGVTRVMVLEDDYRTFYSSFVNSVVQGDSTPERLAHIAKLVASSSWDLLRFGYNALNYSKGVECVPRCICHPTPESQDICVVNLPDSNIKQHCDIRSFVGYAVHKNLRSTLEAYAHASLANLTLSVGNLAEARENYKGSKHDLGIVSTPQDIYLPSTIQRIHYFAPGFVYQSAKPAQISSMEAFGALCKTNRVASTTAAAASTQELESLKSNQTATSPPDALQQATTSRVATRGGNMQHALSP